MDVEVIDPVPLFRLGLVRALELDARVAQPLTSRQPSPQTVVFLTLSDEESWSLLTSIQHRDHLAVVAVLHPFTLNSAARALRGGSVHVISHAAAPGTFRQVWTEVTEGTVSLPVEVMQATIAQAQQVKTGTKLDDNEIRWLRALGRGDTVASVAEATGLSERALYRRLAQLYRRLGVANRTRALMLGHDQGWL